MRKCILCHMRTTNLISAFVDRCSRFYTRNFKTLASFCDCAGRFVSGLVRNSRRHVLSCRGSHVCACFRSIKYSTCEYKQSMLHFIIVVHVLYAISVYMYIWNYEQEQKNTLCMKTGYVHGYMLSGVVSLLCMPDYL